MRELKLTGREVSILRAIDGASGSTGEEIMARTNMDEEELGDTLRGLADIGLVEAYAPNEHSIPYAEAFPTGEVGVTRFETNPAYVQEIRLAMKRN